MRVTTEEPCTREESPDPSLGEIADIKNETLETLYGDNEDESLDGILVYGVINLYQSQVTLNTVMGDSAK